MEVSDSHSPLRVLIWNINGLPNTVANAKLRYGSWQAFFQAHRLHIMCLQESKLREDKLTKELCCLDGYESFWACSKAEGRLGAAGVTTYVATAWSPLSCEVDCLGEHDDRGDSCDGAELSGEGRVVITDLGAFVLVNVYVPNAGDVQKGRPRLAYKMRFLAALRRRCDALADAGREVLLVGDLNVAYDERDVHPRIGLGKCYSDEERRFMLSLTGRYVDVWRRLHPGAAGVYTVWDEKTSARAFNEGVRIDYALATPSLLPKITSCEVLGADVLPPKWSDHAGMVLEIEGLRPPPPHPPCAEWSRLNRRFHDPSQRSIASMFGGRKQQGTKREADGPASKATHPEAGGGARRQPPDAASEAVDGRGAGPDTKRRRGEPEAAGEEGAAVGQPRRGGKGQPAPGKASHKKQQPPAAGNGIAAFFPPAGAL